MEEKKKIWKNWKVWVVILIIIIAFFALVCKLTSKKMPIASEINLGDTITLSEEEKGKLREKTIDNIKGYLKAPSTAKFQEIFTYTCTEPNIVKVQGYVDSQNSFGAMLRGDFTCEYFVIGNMVDTLVYIKYNDEEIFNIRDNYIEEYKKQLKLDYIKESGTELSQEKLNFIKEEFNGDKLNNVGKITEVSFDKNQSKMELQIIAESSKKSKEDREYWINFNICSVLHYFNKFDLTGEVQIIISDIDNNKIVEIIFDNSFLRDKWKNNSKINLVKELFGENYKEI